MYWREWLDSGAEGFLGGLPEASAWLRFSKRCMRRAHEQSFNHFARHTTTIVVGLHKGKITQWIFLINSLDAGKRSSLDEVDLRSTTCHMCCHSALGFIYPSRCDGSA